MHRAMRKMIPHGQFKAQGMPALGWASLKPSGGKPEGLRLLTFVCLLDSQESAAGWCRLATAKGAADRSRHVFQA